jgi:hypothetical protein
MPQVFIKIALFAWPVVVLFLFARLPKHRALIAGVLAGTLFLPEIQMSKASEEAPDASEFLVLALKFTKPNTICFSVLLGALVFDGRRLLTFRPRWFDVPMLLWCLSPFVSNLSNGVGLYDSFAQTRDQTLIWGVPYILGRVYFDNAARLRELAIGFVLGGLAYVPVCLFEWRMFPRCHLWLYGFFPGSPNEAIRWDGYRPVGFMSHGLMLGLWMVAATLVAVWLWQTGAVTSLSWRANARPIRMVWPMASLLVTTALVRSTGALVLGVAAIGGVYELRWLKWPVLLVVLLAASPAYIAARSAGWSARELTEINTNLFGQDRAGSVQYRIDMENRLLAKTRERPLLGWGDQGEGRKVIRTSRKDKITEAVTDGWWGICLNSYGFVGLSIAWVVLLLPPARFMCTYSPRLWSHPAFAPAAALAVVLIIYAIDNLFNAFLNVGFLLAAGGLSSVTGARLTQPVASSAKPTRQTAPAPQRPAPQPPVPLKPAARRPGVLNRPRPS